MGGSYDPTYLGDEARRVDYRDRMAINAGIDAVIRRSIEQHVETT
jgi:hypothetical protein